MGLTRFVLRRHREVLAFGVAAVVMTVGASPAFATNPVCPDASSSTADSCTWSTPGTPTFTVPAGVVSVDVVATGASGGRGLTAAAGGSTATAGGPGASVEDAAVPVTGGESLGVVVGGQGGEASVFNCSPCGGSAAAGGSPGNGGGAGALSADGTDVSAGGGGGGGYSGVLTGTTPLVIAGGGGGGGAGYEGYGGTGGAGDTTGAGGGDGVTYDSSTLNHTMESGFGGGGGTPSAGGAGGAGAGDTFCADTPREAGSAGSSLQGGASTSSSHQDPGGAGGGGYFGGGGGGNGCAGGGGGGGSSYGITGLSRGAAHSGAGSVTISWVLPAYLRSIGTSGSGDGQFGSPQGVVVDPNTGVVFIADQPHSRIEVFDPHGAYLESIPTQGPPDGIAGDFSQSPALLYVTEPGAPGNVELIDASGYSYGFVDLLPGPGASLPTGVAADATRGAVYVADSGNNRIDVYSTWGNWQSSFDGTGGGGNGFSDPTGVAVDSSTGDLYVADSRNHRVVHLNSSGSVLGTFGTEGTGAGQFIQPVGLAIEPGTGDVYTVDAQNNRIERFTSGGAYVGVLGRTGTGAGAFHSPWGISFGPDGSFYATDSGNNRIEKFGTPGPLAQFAISVAPSLAAGASQSVKIVPEDASGNVIVNYNGARWSDSSGQLSGAVAAFSDGVSDNAVTLLTPAHADRITVTDGSVSSSSQPFDVVGALSRFLVNGPGSTSIGRSTAVAVYAEDSAGNIVRGYTGSPTWSDTSGQVSGSPASFVHGRSLNAVTFPDPARRDHLSVSDGTATGRSAAFDVVGPVTHFAVSMPRSFPQSGTATLTVRALDSAGNLVTGYAPATLPTYAEGSGPATGSVASISGGISETSVSVSTPVRGDHMTVTDGASSGTSGAFNAVGSLSRFGLKVPASMHTGSPVSLTLTAYDSAGNIASGYAGTPTWSDASAEITGSPSAFRDGVSATTFTFTEPVSHDLLTVTDGLVSSTATISVGGSAVNRACPTATSSTATSCTWTTPGTPSFTVPLRVTNLDVVAAGGSGGQGAEFSYGTGDGGPGASVEDTTVPVTGGEALNVVVGGQGGTPQGGSPGGGGNAEWFSGGGGGLSGVFTSTGTPLVVGGGGGGGGIGTPSYFGASAGASGGAGDTSGGSGDNGRDKGQDGAPYSTTTDAYPGTGGLGGSMDGIGGFGGTRCDPNPQCHNGGAGSSLQGGSTVFDEYNAGGGGGGGYVGGGGGGDGFAPGGGGGGSSYGVTGLVNGHAHTGQGSLTISWTVPSYLRHFGSAGGGDGRLGSPQGVLVESSAHGSQTFVADHANRRIEEFGPDGSFAGSVSLPGQPAGIAADVTSTPGTFFAAEPNLGQVAIVGGDATAHGTITGLTTPTGVTVDPSRGAVFVTDAATGEVGKYSEQGALQATFPRSGDAVQLSHPSGIAVDASSGDVYVADTSNDRVVVFDESGNYLRQFGSAGTVSGHLLSPTGVAVQAGTKDVFVVDTGNNRVERFALDGTYIGAWGSAGGANGQFRSPWGVATASDGSFLVTDSGNDRVEKFGMPGVFAQFAVTVAARAAGAPSTVTVTAEDAAGNVVSAYAGSPSWSDVGGQLSVPPSAFAGGVSSTAVTFANPVRADRITVTDGSVSSQSAAFNVVGPLARFLLRGPGFGPTRAASTVSITALDSLGDALTRYSGTPTWSDASGQVSGHPAAFTNGVSANTVSFTDAVHADRITVTDGSVSSEGSVFSRLGPLARFGIVTPASPTTGTAFTVTLRAYDSSGNLLTAYAGSPSWSDGSGQVSGSPAPFTGGVSQTSLAFSQPVHGDVVTVADGAISSTRAISVVGPFAKFFIRVPSSAVHGTAFPVAVYAQDTVGNRVKGYAGSATWSDSSGQLSGSPAMFSGGVSTNSVTFANPVARDRIGVTAGSVSAQSAAFPIS